MGVFKVPPIAQITPLSEIIEKTFCSDLDDGRVEMYEKGIMHINISVIK